MADIFISYARKDLKRVEPIVKELQKRGWSVFWDLEIPPGETWRSYIKKRLDESRCVLVVWSHISITSKWVIAEADEAKKRGILVPVRLDAVEPPFGLSHIHAADLSEWKNNRSHQEFGQLIVAIEDKISNPMQSSMPETAPSTDGKSNFGCSSLPSPVPPTLQYAPWSPRSKIFTFTKWKGWISKNVKSEDALLKSEKTKGYTVVRVFFATDRNQTLDKMFGDQRSELNYGYCDISIPSYNRHYIGKLETPVWWRFEFLENPDKHVMLQKMVISPKEDFFQDLVNCVRNSKEKNTFLFVHGYNVTFEDAAKRTAQISYDLSFDGAPVFYSWPSQGSTVGYMVDEQSIEWAQPHLKKFLKDFFTQADAKHIYLIAHSMGSRALTRAVTELLTDMPFLRKRLKEVILAAPDIDADVFMRDIAPALASAGRPITLYASSKDKALIASKGLHGYPRAGDSGQGLVIVPGIETIDATSVETDLVGHNYFTENRSLLGDIFTLIATGKRADKRFGLRPVHVKAGTYWEFKP